MGILSGAALLVAAVSLLAPAMALDPSDKADAQEGGGRGESSRSHQKTWLVGLFIVIGVGLFLTRRYYLRGRETRRGRLNQDARYRVRDQVWKMQDASGIESVMRTVGDCLREMGIPYSYYGVNVVHQDTEAEVSAYTMDNKGEWHRRRVIESPLIHQLWRQGEMVYRRDLHTLDPYGERPRLTGMRSVADIPFSHGTLAMSSSKAEAFSTDSLDLLQQLARVLSEGFHRMDDLRALEQRRAELAETEKRLSVVERLRGVIWRMEDGSDPATLVGVVGDCLADLGVSFHACGVNVIESHSPPQVSIYETGGQSQGGRQVETDTHDAHTITSFWRAGETVYRRDLREDDDYGEQPFLDAAWLPTSAS